MRGGGRTWKIYMAGHVRGLSSRTQGANFSPLCSRRATQGYSTKLKSLHAQPVMYGDCTCVTRLVFHSYFHVYRRTPYLFYPASSIPESLVPSTLRLYVCKCIHFVLPSIKCFLDFPLGRVQRKKEFLSIGIVEIVFVYMQLAA